MGRAVERRAAKQGSKTRTISRSTLTELEKFRELGQSSRKRAAAAAKWWEKIRVRGFAREKTGRSIDGGRGVTQLR